MPNPQALNTEQYQYVETQVNAQAGFKLLTSNITGTNKLYIEFVAPNGAENGWSEPSKEKDWKTDYAKFKLVADAAVVDMVRHFS